MDGGQQPPVPPSPLRPLAPRAGAGRAEGPPPEVDWPQAVQVPVSALAVDPAYQRPVSCLGERLIARIVADFDPAAFGMLLGRWEGERFAVIDGQHRAMAALELGLRVVPCLAMRGGNAAAVFGRGNRARTALRPIDRWRAAAAAGEPEAVALAGICDGLGLSPSHRVPLTDESGAFVPGTVLGCVQRAWKMVRVHGGPVIEAALGCLQDAEVASDNPLLTSALVAATADIVAGLFADPARENDLGGALDALSAVLARKEAEAWMARARSVLPSAVGAVPKGALVEAIRAEMARGAP